MLGNEVEKLKELVPKGKIGYIPNAGDGYEGSIEEKTEWREMNVGMLHELGLKVEYVDLREYFGRSEELRKKIEELGAIFVGGGNVFVLRQAMKLSGLDGILKSIRKEADFLYAGYSAGGCVLAPSLKGYEIVDPLAMPYPEQKEIIWEGLGLVDFSFMPHWDSDHPESADIEKAIEHCKQNDIPYKAARDGEVIIIQHVDIV